jgi:hypothetical protein
VDLFNLTAALQRAVAPPGEFKSLFPSANDESLAGTLADGLAEAQLDGFLSKVGLDADAYSTDVDLTSAQQALVVLYARARIVTARLANLKNRTRYKAGPVEAETEQAASVLVQILKDTSDRKKALLDQARYGSGGTSFTMVDLYVSRSLDLGNNLAYSASELGYTNGAI